MKNNHKDIINILMQHNQPVSSKSLAKILNISTRTVINYVHEINRSLSNKIILSTKTGYLINKENAKEFLSKTTNSIPENYEERSIYIIKELLIGKINNLNIYDLCDSLFVSYATIKNDISKMNKKFSSFNVTFTTQNNTLKISGTELSKRKLVSYILTEEIHGKLMNIQTLKENFSDETVDKVFKILKTTLKKYNYYINDFSYLHLIMHLLIIIDRLVTGNSIINIIKSNIDIGFEQELVNDLCSQLENEFEISFNEHEYFEIIMLFRSNSNYNMSAQNIYLDSLLDEKVNKLSKEIIKKIKEMYFIDLSNDSFMKPFLLHVSKMIARIKSNSYIKNPMVENIKNSCPIIYDIAIFISINFMESYDININEDEITFIALHVGAEIERQESNVNKISCAILCPNYGELSIQLYNQISFKFGTYLNIKKVVSFENELEDINIDLLITTIKIKENINYETILVPPFSTKIDKLDIFDKIYEIQNSRKYRVLKENFTNYFSEELFFINNSNSSKEKIITMLSEKMYSIGLVDKDFTDSVLEREKAASTAFFKIAIPHSVRSETFKTNIAVCISKQGINWDSNVVHLVLLIAMNNLDRKTFRALYEALVMLFNNDSIIKLIRNCTSFSEFENIIYTGISHAIN